ncbi:DUF1648 domain-containing protein [Verrucomicrobiota bacterium]
MRTIFIISFAVNLILTVVTLVLHPSDVAIHFGAGGEPNGWAPAYVNALIMSGVNVLILASFLFTPQLLRITPTRWINLPNKEYWLKEENRGRTESMLATQLYQFGTLTFMFMFIMGLLSLQANLSDPVRLRENLFWWPFGFYIAYTVYWTVKLMLMFRVPKEELR